MFGNLFPFTVADIEEEFINKDFSSFNAFYDQRTGIVIFVGIESDYPLSVINKDFLDGISNLGSFTEFDCIPTNIQRNDCTQNQTKNSYKRFFHYLLQILIPVCIGAIVGIPIIFFYIRYFY
jgi:hypothetical protein